MPVCHHAFTCAPVLTSKSPPQNARLPNRQITGLVRRAVAGQTRLVLPCSSTISTTANSKATSQWRQGASSSTQAKPIGSSSQRDFSDVSLIVWHKDNRLDSPIFTADARTAGSLAEAKKVVSWDHLAGRVQLDYQSDHSTAPALVISEPVGEDAGIYTCTIEFYKAPTQTHQVKAEIIG